MTLHYDKLRNGATVLRLIALGIGLVALVLFIRSYTLQDRGYYDGIGYFFDLLCISGVSSGHAIYNIVSDLTLLHSSASRWPGAPPPSP